MGDSRETLSPVPAWSVVSTQTILAITAKASGPFAFYFSSFVSFPYGTD